MSVDNVAWAWQATGITPTAKLCLLWLANHCGDRLWFQFDGKRLAEFVGSADSDSVAPALEELLDAGYMEEGGPEVCLLTPGRQRALLQERYPSFPEPSPHRRRTGFVYFVRSLDLIKIGTSRDPRTRIQTLRKTWPNPITVLKVVEGSYKTEREYHERFCAQRRMGEWFDVSDQLTAFIDGLTAAMVLE